MATDAAPRPCSLSPGCAPVAADRPALVEVASGVDALYLSGRGSLPPWVALRS